MTDPVVTDQSLKGPRFLVLGYNAWDVSLPATEMPAPDRKYEVPEIRSGGGGPGATAAVALSRLGGRVSLVTVMGDDPPSRWQRRELTAAGVDLTASVVVPGAASPRAVIMVSGDTGERCIFWSRGSLPHLPAGQVQTSWLDGRDLFYTDGHDTAAATILAREAGRRDIPVVMDAGTVREGSAGLVAAATDVISSEVFAPDLTGMRDPTAALRALRERGPRKVGMTFGAGGVLALDDDGLVHVPAFAVPVIDTTGAGDAFHAGYAFARATGRTFVDCLHFGSAVAALKCTAWGGREGLPELKAVEDLLRHGTRLPLPDHLRPACDGH